MRPEHHHPGNKLDPVVPGGDNTFDGAVDPELGGKSELDKNAGQPDTWPQRTDVEAKNDTKGWPLFGEITD